jgi:acetoin utilization protein AcuB
MKAQDVMTRGPVSVRATAPLREAIAVLQSLSVRHLPVIDRHGELVGVLTDRDLRKYAFSDVWPELSTVDIEGGLELPVSHAMSKAVWTVEPETNLEEVANLMISAEIGAVPVVDSDGALVGIVSYVDMLRELAPLAATA